MENWSQVTNEDMKNYFLEQEKDFPSDNNQVLREDSTFLEKLLNKLENLNPQTELSKKNQCVVNFSCDSSESLKLLKSRLKSYDIAFSRDDCGFCSCLNTNCRAKSLSGYPFIAFREIEVSETALTTLQNIKKKGCSLSQFKIGKGVIYELMGFVLYEGTKYKCIVDFHFARPKDVTDPKRYFVIPESVKPEFEMNMKEFLAKTNIREILYFKTILPGSSYLDKFLEQIDLNAAVVNNKVPQDENLENIIRENLAVLDYGEQPQGSIGYLNKAFAPCFTRGEGFSFYCITRRRDNEENCNRCLQCGQLYPKYIKKCILHK